MKNQKAKCYIFIRFLQPPPMKKSVTGASKPEPSTYFDLVKPAKNNNHVCLHKDSCDSYIMTVKLINLHCELILAKFCYPISRV